MKKARFPAYASHEELGQGLKRGQYFKANLRVNAHDRSQAFATLPDLPSDLMIRVIPLFLVSCCMPFKVLPVCSRCLLRQSVKHIAITRSQSCRGFQLFGLSAAIRDGHREGFVEPNTPSLGSAAWSCKDGKGRMLVGTQGSVAQNRAVEGDIVALEILPPSSWFIAGALIKPDSGGGGGGGGRALQHSASAMVALTSAGVDLPDDCSGPAAADVMSGANGEAAGGSFSSRPCLRRMLVALHGSALHCLE